MIAFDTNILIYAELPAEDDSRHQKAANLLRRAGLVGSIMPLQVLGEFLHVCRRKAVINHEFALQRTQTFASVFDTPPTSLNDVINAQVLLQKFNLQFFDALIITVASRAGATMLLSEDMQQGFVHRGLTIVNPLADTPHPQLARLLDLPA